jgi:hypothetical protein
MSQKDLGLSYRDALHGVQSAISYEMEMGIGRATHPKHLRVGVDSAMISDAAVVRLLIEKGVFTEEEFEESLRLQANYELDSYQQKYKVAFR